MNTTTPTAIVQEVNLADSMVALQNVIERNAAELFRIKNELKNKRESLKSVFDNDSELSAANDEVEQVKIRVKARKAQMSSNPEVVGLKATISELNEQKKEIEETLSNHLVNYHSMTNSSSFDTSDGEQMEFSIKASIKPSQLKLFE